MWKTGRAAPKGGGPPLHVSRTHFLIIIIRPHATHEEKAKHIRRNITHFRVSLIFLTVQCPKFSTNKYGTCQEKDLIGKNQEKKGSLYDFVTELNDFNMII